MTVNIFLSISHNSHKYFILKSPKTNTHTLFYKFKIGIVQSIFTDSLNFGNFRQSSSNDLIILTSNDLSCYACPHTSNKTPECMCESTKCVIRTQNANSTGSLYLISFFKKPIRD